MMFDTNGQGQTDKAIGEDMTKVAIIEDQRTLRDGFRMLIDGTEGLQCVGAFRTMEETLE